MLTFPIDPVLSERAAAALQGLENEAIGLVNILAQVRPISLQAPAALTEWIAKVNTLKGRLSQAAHSEPHHISFSEEESQLLRTAVALQRRKVAEGVNATHRLLQHGGLAKTVQSRLEPFDQLLSGPLSNIAPLRRPHVGDFLTGTGRESVGIRATLGEPALDPKHGILLSASLLTTDLAAYRQECEHRGLPLAIAFADLDDFKAINTAIGQVPVDHQLLPLILSAVEASAFGHGRAYRFGGDEFVLLLPNASAAIATLLVKGLKANVEGLHFEPPITSVRLSAGIWISEPETPLSAAELIDRAERAKERAKELGRSRIVIRTETASGFVEDVVE